MKLDDILNEWKEDVQIDKTELATESVNIPLLHHKYLRILMEEGLSFKRLSAEYKALYRVKWEYYLGFSTEEELKSRSWMPMLQKVLRSDVDIYLNSDKDLTELKLRMEYQEQKIKALEEIIKSINNRNFTIKNSIDWSRFQHGQ